MNCRYVASTEPRIIPGRHDDDCAGIDCTGCQPCLEPHCRVCGRAHVDGTCAECLAETREDLAAIGLMCNALPAEVIHRGVESEAMTLLGPAADPEAWGHMSASVKVGRLPAGYLASADGELHPLFILGTWDMCWRAELEHDDAATITLDRAVGYLDQQMTYMAGYEHAPFEDFARDLRRCRSHLERVLHDGEQIETGAPCMVCEIPLRREWGRFAAADGWRCPRCREWRSDQDYRLNVAELHRKEATWLTDRDMEIRTGVKAGTVRSWARDGDPGDPPALVRKRRDAGRTLYAVSDVLVTAVDKGLLDTDTLSGEVVA